MRLFMKQRGGVFLLLLILLFSYACEKETQDNPILTFEDEKAIGEKLATILKTDEDYRVLKNIGQNEELYTHLRNLLRSLVNTNIVSANSEQKGKFDWQVYVIANDSKQSVITLPGGQIFIYTGLLKFIENESQLLGVLAHEIGYTDRTHAKTEAALSPIISLIKSQLLSGGDGTRRLLEIVTEDDIELAKQFIISAESIAFNNEIVMNSDIKATEMLCGFAWSPEGLRNILSRIKRQNIPNFDWLITRPPTIPNELETRIGKLEDLTTSCNGNPENTFSIRYTEKVLNNLP